MSTIQTIVDRLRVRLEEATERKWSDADQLIPYASEAERWFARYFSRIPGSNRFRYRESITLAADTETYDLTTLTKRFDYMIEIAVQVSSLWVVMLPYQDGDESTMTNLALGGGHIVSRWTLDDETLYVNPTYGASRTLRLRYGYVPTIKSSAGDTLETPDEYLLDVVNRALHFALADAGVGNSGFEEEYAVRLAEIEDLERSRMGTKNERVVSRNRDFSRCR